MPLDAKGHAVLRQMQQQRLLTAAPLVVTICPCRNRVSQHGRAAVATQRLSSTFAFPRFCRRRLLPAAAHAVPPAAAHAAAGSGCQLCGMSRRVRFLWRQCLQYRSRI